MYLKKINLKNFRNIESSGIEFHPSLNIFVGENGQGKTNLLESLYILSWGRLFRPGTWNHLVNENMVLEKDKVAFLEAEIQKTELDFKLGAQIGSQRKFLCNSKNISVAQLYSVFPTILFSPESLTSIKSGPEQRRLLADEFAVIKDSQNRKLIQEFKKTLITRNRILKSIKEKRSPSSIETTLEVINDIHLKTSTQLTLERFKALKEIETKIEQNLSKILGQKVDFSVDYVISDSKLIDPTEEIVYNALLKRLKDLRSAEIASGLSLVGPHKHDIVFNFNGSNSRFYCSQGQQRAIILALKLGQISYFQAKHGFCPALLLDDVLSELDQGKQRYLVEFLEETEAQIFVTTTDSLFPSMLKKLDLKIFEIKNGAVKRG